MSEPVITTPAAEPAAPPAIFGETPGSFAADWHRHIPGMEDHAAVAANFTDLPSVFKALKDNMAGARGKAGLQPLPLDATEDQRTAWEGEVRKLLGVPEKADVESYGLKPAELPEGTVWNEERAAKFAEAAHKAGMTPKQAVEMQSLYLAIQQEEAASQKTAFDAGLAKEQEALKEVFGDKLNSTVNAAQRVALALNLPSDVMNPQSPNFMALSGVQVLQMAAKLADAMGESNLPKTTAVTSLSPRDQAMDIINNPANPLHAAYNRGDAAANATVDRLLAAK